jgi:hypothetical protein
MIEEHDQPEDNSEEPTVILDDDAIDELEELSLNAILAEVTYALDQTGKNPKLNLTAASDSITPAAEARVSLLSDISKLGKPDCD